MWNRFGRVYLVNGDVTRYRRESMMEEVRRIGLSCKDQFRLLCGDFKSSHDAHLVAMRDFAEDRSVGGCALIIEDDTRFLRDLGELKSLLASAPPADIVNFDPFFHLTKETLRQTQGNRFMYWTRGIYGTSCYSVSKVAAMVLWMSYTRHPEEPPDSHLFLGHQDLCTVVSTKHACVQLTYEDSVNSKRFGVDVQHKFYGNEGVDYSKYAVPEGFGYGKAIVPDGRIGDIRPCV